MGKKQNAKPPNLKSKIPNIGGFIAGVLLGLGAAMIIGFEFAPWFIGIGVLAIAVVIVSDNWFRYKLEQQFKSKQVRMIIYSILLALCIPAFIVSQIRVNQQKEIIANPPDNSYITAGNGVDPVPQNVQVVNLGDEPPITKDRLTIMFGDKVGAYLRKDQRYIIAQKGEPLFSIGFNSRGALSINASIYDSKDNQIIKISGGEFSADLRSDFKIRQLNNHTLIVNDSFDNEVLNIDFINPTAIRISGRFYLKGYTEPFIITSNSNIDFDGFHVNDTEPFMFDATSVKDPYLIDVTDKGGIRLGGHVFGEGMGSAK